MVFSIFIVNRKELKHKLATVFNTVEKLATRVNFCCHNTMSEIRNRPAYFEYGHRRQIRGGDGIGGHRSKIDPGGKGQLCRQLLPVF